MSVKEDLAIYSHIVDASGQCMSISLILGLTKVYILCKVFPSLIAYCYGIILTASTLYVSYHT